MGFSCPGGITTSDILFFALVEEYEPRRFLRVIRRLDDVFLEYVFKESERKKNSK